jgi:hypothetical protein
MLSRGSQFNCGDTRLYGARRSEAVTGNVVNVRK